MRASQQISAQVHVSGQLSDDAIERMVMALAHELRTPLTALRGLAAVLESLHAPDDEGARRDITARLLDKALQMERVLDSMLNAARDGRLEPLQPQLLNLHAIVLDAVGEMGPVLDRHMVRVSGTITYAFADPSAVTCILTCLLTNAARYSPPGSRIEVETHERSGWARLTISDAGPGVPAPDRANIFVPFWRAENAYPRVRGLGVDLSIAHDLCVRSGGHLSVHDAAEGGALFEFELPRH